MGSLVGRSRCREGSRRSLFIFSKVMVRIQNSIEGTSGFGKDFSLKAMYDALLDMKFNVDLMLNWVKWGLGPVGSEGLIGKDMQMGIKMDG